MELYDHNLAAKVDWKLPWSTILDGRPWKLTRGVDFDGDPRLFRRTVYYMQRMYGSDPLHCKVRTRVLLDGILVQIVNQDGSPWGAGIAPSEPPAPEPAPEPTP